MTEIVKIESEVGHKIIEQDGVFMILNVAYWSGPALMALKKCTDWAEFFGLPKVIVIDHDKSESFWGKYKNLHMGGWCDIFIIKDRKVVYINNRPNLRTIHDELSIIATDLTTR